MSDEQFHEFQLDGKQLVFLFMAGTVVAVVIFLCGVMVGRGVQTPIDESAEFAAAVAEPEASLEEIPGGPSLEGVSPPTLDELTYTESLPSATPAPDALREPTPPPAVVPAPEPPPLPPRPSAAAVRAPSSRPARGTFVIQVTSVTRRAEAESVAKSLSSKGYPAFVEATPDRHFRVRVGTYDDRTEAERVARRLEKDEKFDKPWVTTP